MTLPAIAYPRGAQFVNQTGHPTREFANPLEDTMHQVNKLREAANDYTPLDPGTATTADIVNALNTIMATLVAQ